MVNLCCSGKKISPDEDHEAKSYGAGDVKRKCRDILCTIIFLAFCLGMVIVASVGVSEGEPMRLVYATDYNGDVCGEGKRGEIAYFPRMNQDLIDSQTKGISPLKTKFYTICTKKCPAVGEIICNYDHTGTPKVDKLFHQGPCWKVNVETKNIMFRCLPDNAKDSNTTKLCANPDGGTFAHDAVDGLGNAYYEKRANGKYYPTRFCESVEVTTISVGTEQGQSNPVFDQLTSIAATLSRWCGDVETAIALVLVCGLVISLLGGLVWLLLLQYAAGCMVWITVILVLGLGVICSFVFSYKGGMIGDDVVAVAANAGLNNPLEENKEDNQTMYQVLAWICIVATTILFMVVLFMWKKVKICIGIMRESSHCIRAIPMMLLWPVVPYFGLVVTIIYWVVIAAFIASAGEIGIGSVTGNSTIITLMAKANSTLYKPEVFESSDISTYLGLYHFFGLLWINQLIQAISMCTIAGATAKYYFARDKSAKGAFGKRPIGTSLYNCFRYHFGSLAFGSLIIAIVQAIRYALAYIDSKTKKLQDKNILIKIMMKVVQCCMWCMEKCLKYIASSAYIMIAMKGHSFCHATREAVGLLWDNLSQIAVSNSIVSFMLLLAKIVISLGSAVLFYILVDGNKDYAEGGSKELSSPAVPLVLTFLLAYFVASTFMNVYGMVVDSILLLFCVDKKENEKADDGYFMSQELARLLGQKDKKGKKEGKDSGSESSDSDDEGK